MAFDTFIAFAQTIILPKSYINHGLQPIFLSFACLSAFLNLQERIPRSEAILSELERSNGCKRMVTEPIPSWEPAKAR